MKTGRRSLTPLWLLGIISLLMVIWIGLESGASVAHAKPGKIAQSVAAQPAATPCGVTFQAVTSPNVGGDHNGLEAISAISANDIWAVGWFRNGGDQALAMHWDGFQWTVVPSPSSGVLYAVSAVSSNDVWAVGSKPGSSVASESLTMHWNGTVWTVVPSPTIGTNGVRLLGVAAIATNDVWAVGNYANGVSQTLAMHWDGSQWTIVSTPNVGTMANDLKAVTAVASNDVWAAGIYWDTNLRPLFLHWNGTQWLNVPATGASTGENRIWSIDAVAPNDIWAVGFHCPGGTCPQGTPQMLTMHWNGTAWSVVPSPNPGAGGYFLYGVSAVSTNEVWAAGFGGPSGNQTLAMRWDGSTWSAVPSANVGSSQIIRGIAAIQPGNAWMVGSSSGSPSRTLILHSEDPCATATPTSTGTPPTATATRTATPTRTATFTNTPTNTATATFTGTPPTATNTQPPAATPTRTGTSPPGPSPTPTGSGTCIPIPGPDGQMPHVPCYATYTPTASPTRSPTVTASTTSQLGCYISVVSATTSCTTQGVYTYQFTLYHNCGTIPSATAYFEVASNPDGPWTELAQQSVPPNYPTVGGTFNVSSIPNQYNWYRVRIYGSAPIPHPSYSGQTMPTHICGRPLPCSGDWTGRAAYPEAASMQAAVVDNGSLYSFGGRDSSGAALSSGYRYDAATNAWTPLAQIPVPRFGASAIEAGGGVYLMNGSDGTSASNQQYIYYSQSNHWQVLGTGLAATYGQTMLKLNEEFIRIGGIDSAGAYTSSVELYSRGWLAPLPEARAYMAAAAIDGYIYAAGGSGPDGPSTKTYRYNRGTNTWDDAAVADLPWPVSGASATYLNGQWILAGGWADNPEAVLAWDRESNAWTTLPPMSSGHAYAASGVLNNALYVAGGLAGAIPTNATERYVQGPCATPTAPPTITGTGSPSATPTRTTTRTPTGSPTTINATIPPTRALTSTPTSCALTFSDVPPENTFYPFIRCLACRGIVNGYPDGTFLPNNPVTRGQLAKIVSQSAGFTEPVSGQTFEDVVPGSTFYEYIERLASREVMGGYQCGVDPPEPCGPENRPYFRPNVGATRGQLTKIVSNAEAWVDPVPPTFYTFADVEPGSTFWLFVERLMFNRPAAMSGYPCGGPGEPCDSENRPYFRPWNPLTRGQASKIVANTFFPDCETPGR